MDDFLRPVKTVRNVKSNIQKFETLSLRDDHAKNDVASTKKIISEASGRTDSSSTISKGSAAREHAADANTTAAKNVVLSEHTQSNKSPGEGVRPVDGPILSQDQALAVLKEQLGEERLEAVLRYLEDGIQKRHNFNLHVPSAPAAQILKVLGTSIIPDRWAILNVKTARNTDRAIRKLLLLCMTSTVGIGVVLAHIQTLLRSPQIRQSGSSQHATFKDTASFFTSMVYHKTFVRDLLHQSQTSGGSPGQQQALWTETTSLFAGSKVLNVFLEASAIPELKSQVPSWLQDARDYSRWLGVNIASAAINVPPTFQAGWKMLASFLKRSLSLGYKGTSDRA